MIVTLTAHPALDRTVTLGAPLLEGEVQSALSVREDAGGKGINVSRVLHAAGVETVAVLPLAAGDPFAPTLAETGLDVRPVRVAGATRTNLAITDPAGVTTKLNLPGATLSGDDAAALVAEIVEATASAQWLVLAGSLPPGLPDDFYVTVISAVRERWAERAPKVAVDTSGEALRHVVAAGGADLIKPNDDELVELVAHPLDVDLSVTDAVVRAAADLVPSRVAAALVTLGSHGAVLVTADGAWQASPPPIEVRSTVGAGDSSLAGYLLASVSGGTPEKALESAIRYGAAAASLPGTQAPTPSDLPTGDVPVRGLSR